mgnify:CR=1 FL=1
MRIGLREQYICSGHQQDGDGQDARPKACTGLWPRLADPLRAMTTLNKRGLPIGEWAR